MMDKLHEQCGIFGIWNHSEAAQLTYLGLYALQHRGQEAAGIVSSEGNSLFSKRGTGHVSEIFTEESLQLLQGNNAIGHVRYSTAGQGGISEAQPFLGRGCYGEFAICHNGNLPFANELRKTLEKNGTTFSSTSDTEILLHKLAQSNKSDIYDAIVETFAEIKGAYSILILTTNALIAVRDPYGFRPMCLGKLGDAYVIASETCAFDLIGATYIRDVAPGEILTISNNGLKTNFPLPKSRATAFCIFEHVYFSRPDSIIFGRSVSKSRYLMGRRLAIEHPIEADVIVPVPDSGVEAAIGYSSESKIELRFGLVRNHYIGRTFIEPSQVIRNFEVKVKFNPVRSSLEGKRVVLIDDSIVRGTTSRKIIELVRKAGATKVHMRISCPPTISPCYYGVDTPTHEELIAHNFAIDEIRKFVGADTLGYLSLEGLLESCGSNHNFVFCDACYTKNYPLEVFCSSEKK